MSLNLGNKVYRNIQEQVAYNTECIKKLDEYLDGISVQDKLVVIANDSGTFTEEELETLSMPLAFIANASKVWIKSNETSSELLYKAVDIEATEVGSAYFKIGGSKIVIDKVTRAFIVSDDELIVTYSKSQIDSIIANIMAVKADKSELTTGLALKANVAGQAFAGAITAPSIIEDMSGYSFTKVNETQWTAIYVGIVKNGNKLTLAIYGELERTTDDIDQGIYLGDFTIPASVGTKLYPDANNNLEWKIINFFLGATDTAPQARTIQCQKTATQTLRIFLRNFKNFALNTRYKFRYEITFLLSDNLAS